MRDAIAGNRPVVALESTIISHGMPYPRNIEVARQVEAVVRSFGAIPATCAIINGKLNLATLIRAGSMTTPMVFCNFNDTLLQSAAIIH